MSNKTSFAEYRLEIRDLTLMQRRTRFWRFTLVISLILPSGEIYAVSFRGCLIFLTRYKDKPFARKVEDLDDSAFFVRPPAVSRDGSMVLNVIEFSKDLSKRIVRMFRAHGLLEELVREIDTSTFHPMPSVTVPESIIEDSEDSEGSENEQPQQKGD